MSSVCGFPARRTTAQQKSIIVAAHSSPTGTGQLAIEQLASEGSDMSTSLIVEAVKVGSLALGDVAVQFARCLCSTARSPLTRGAWQDLTALCANPDAMPRAIVRHNVHSRSYPQTKCATSAALHLVLGMGVGRVVAALLRLPAALLRCCHWPPAYRTARQYHWCSFRRS